ncbi:MAG: hypothetical protein AB7I04_16470 [Pseudomonadales bacterium]
MPHTIEPATTGRSKCRACGETIAKGVLRFGERLPNPFGEEGSETTHWYHVRCGAFRRPESFLEAADLCTVDLEDAPSLRAAAAFGVAHRRVPRIDSVDRAPSSRARCRACHDMIERDTWRIGIVFFEEGRTSPGGYLHAACSRRYFETEPRDDDALLDRLHHFGNTLTPENLTSLARLLDASAIGDSTP